MTARKRPAGPPPSAGVLARYAQAYARELGVAESRVRAWVAYMILAGLLERTAVGDIPRFIVKGGVALELRLRDRARATKDIDIVLRDPSADLADSLEEALTGEGYQGFSFRRKGQPLLLDNGAVNIEFGVTYRGHPWTSISVDAARAEPGEVDVEWVDAIALTDVFGVTGPAQLPCLPLRFHVAQKLHGMTFATTPREAERAVPGPRGSPAHGGDDHARLRGASLGVRTGLQEPRYPHLAPRPERRASALGPALRTARRRAGATRHRHRSGTRPRPQLRHPHRQFAVMPRPDPLRTSASLPLGQHAPCCAGVQERARTTEGTTSISQVVPLPSSLPTVERLRDDSPPECRRRRQPREGQQVRAASRQAARRTGGALCRPPANVPRQPMLVTWRERPRSARRDPSRRCPEGVAHAMAAAALLDVVVRPSSSSGRQHHRSRDPVLGVQELVDVSVREDRAHLRARERRPAQTAGHHAGESRPVLGAVKARRYAPPAGS